MPLLSGTLVSVSSSSAVVHQPASQQSTTPTLAQAQVSPVQPAPSASPALNRKNPNHCQIVHELAFLLFF